MFNDNDDSFVGIFFCLLLSGCGMDNGNDLITLIMKYVETKSTNRFPLSPRCLSRYVDDGKWLTH